MNLGTRKKCLLSIVVPNYNNGSFIERCLESILCSKRKDFEVIVVDDGSTDDSVDIVRKIEDMRLKVFTQENQGVSAARNYGIKEARGEFVTFCDSDDYYCEDAINRLLDLVDSYGSANDILVFDACIEGMDAADKKTRTKWESFISRFGEGGTAAPIDCRIYMELLCSNSDMNSTVNKVYKYTLLTVEEGLFPVGIGMGEDGIFNLRCAANCASVIYIPQILYVYCRDESENSSGKRKCRVSTIGELLEGMRIRNEIIKSYCQRNHADDEEMKRLERLLDEYGIEQLYHWCSKIRKNSGRDAYCAYFKRNPTVRKELMDYLKKSVCWKRRIQLLILLMYIECHEII